MLATVTSNCLETIFIFLKAFYKGILKLKAQTLKEKLFP